MINMIVFGSSAKFCTWHKHYCFCQLSNSFGTASLNSDMIIMFLERSSRHKSMLVAPKPVISLAVLVVYEQNWSKVSFFATEFLSAVSSE